MSMKIEVAHDRRLQSVAADAGFFGLPKSLQEGLKDMLVGAIKVFRLHASDPERGDIGWREQTVEYHLRHAQAHCRDAFIACDGDRIILHLSADNDGLEHRDHAAARLALVCCKLRLMEEETPCHDS